MDCGLKNGKKITKKRLDFHFSFHPTKLFSVFYIVPDTYTCHLLSFSQFVETGNEDSHCLLFWQCHSNSRHDLADLAEKKADLFEMKTYILLGLVENLAQKARLTPVKMMSMTKRLLRLFLVSQR